MCPCLFNLHCMSVCSSVSKQQQLLQQPPPISSSCPSKRTPTNKPNNNNSHHAQEPEHNDDHHDEDLRCPAMNVSCNHQQSNPNQHSLHLPQQLAPVPSVCVRVPQSPRASLDSNASFGNYYKPTTTTIGGAACGTEFFVSSPPTSPPLPRQFKTLEVDMVSAKNARECVPLESIFQTKKPALNPKDYLQFVQP